MYRIVYTKQAVKDIKNLKSVHLDEKAKKLIEVIKENPFQNPPPYEELLGNLINRIKVTQYDKRKRNNAL